MLVAVRLTGDLRADLTGNALWRFRKSLADAQSPLYYKDICFATPAIADGRIYIRTNTALYCFAKTS